MFLMISGDGLPSSLARVPESVSQRPKHSRRPAPPVVLADIDEIALRDATDAMTSWSE